MSTGELALALVAVVAAVLVLRWAAALVWRLRWLLAIALIVAVVAQNELM